MLSAKLLFILTIGIFFLLCRSQEKQIRGTPEVDYPTYYIIPKTSFRCSDQLYNPGFYADTETRCQVFHYCYEHRQESFLCPMGTIFNQPILACDYWYSSDCSLAPSYYRVNAVKRNQDFSDEVDEPQDSHSENLFSKMAHLYEVNTTPESPVLKNDSDISENALLGRDSIEPSGEPLIERNNETDYYNKYSYDTQFNMVDEKHPEIVKYEVVGLNGVKIHKDSENEEPYETDNGKDFILSEDGMLHPNQEDIHQLYPTDMNFDQGYSGYAEIPSGEHLNDNLYDDYESDYQMSDYELQKRYSTTNGGYVRRPLSLKPIIVPEVEPEIVQLPILKHKRKPVGVPSTTITNANGESSYETTYDSNIRNEDALSFGSKDFKGTDSSKFLLEETSSNLNYVFNDTKLFYEKEEQDNDENGLFLHQTENSRIIYDYSNKTNTRNAYVLLNKDENDISSIFGSGFNDHSGISNDDQRNTLLDSNYDDESATFIKNSESSIVLPGATSDTVAEGSFYNDPFFGSGSEENIIQLHSRDEPSFSENQDIFSDSEDIETTDSEISYELPMNLSDTFEGSGISIQKIAKMPNFVEEISEPIEFNFKNDSEDSNEYNRESNFSLKTFGEFSPSANSQHDEGVELVPDGSAGYSDFDYLPQDLHESSDIHEPSDKMVPEIQEIDGSYYYVFPDAEYNSNSEYEDSNEFYSENEDYAVTENFDASSGKSPEELINNLGSHYVPADSKLKTDNTENLSDEFEMEVSSKIPEKYVIDDSDYVGELSAEDLKFLEIMSQTPIPMPMNLFDVSNEKSSSDAVKDEIPPIEIESQATTREDTDSMEDMYEPENLSSDTSSDSEEHSADIESSEINPKISDNEQKIAKGDSFIESSGQEESEFSPEQNLEILVPEKETDPFNPLFAEDKEIFGSPEKYYPVIENFDFSSDKSPKVMKNKIISHHVPEGPKLETNNTKKLPGSGQKPSLKINSVKLKSPFASPVTKTNLKKVERGKRFNENLRTFNPSSKGNPLITPSRETFREAAFSKIPSTFLKMKHSSVRPYFYNYNLKNSEFNPRTGDLSELSKLTSLGKRLLEGKRSKFNTMKKYVNSYRYF